MKVKGRMGVGLSLMCGVVLAAVGVRMVEAGWVVLQTGDIIRGDIDERKDGKVRIRLAAGGVVYKLASEIAAEEKDLPFDERLTLGHKLLSQRDYPLAHRHFSIAFQERRESPEAVLGLLLSLDGLGKTAEAVKLGQDSVLLHPRHARLKLAYGEALSKVGQFDKAEQMIRDAGALEPLNAGLQEMMREALKQNAERKRAGAKPNPNPNPSSAPSAVDKTLGNNADAAETAQELLLWAKAPNAKHAETFITVRLELSATQEGEDMLKRGNKTGYRGEVREAHFTVTVNETAWMQIEPDIPTFAKPGADENLRERKLTLMGWFYQLRSRYGPANNPARITVTVIAERSRKEIASAEWDSSLKRVAFKFADKPK